MTAVTLFEIQRIAADADGFPGMTMGAEFIDLPIPWLRQEKDTSPFFPAKMAICPGGSPYFEKPTGVDHTTAEKKCSSASCLCKAHAPSPERSEGSCESIGFPYQCHRFSHRMATPNPAGSSWCSSCPHVFTSNTLT